MTNPAPTASPHAQALAAAVPGARGWFRFAQGSVNVRFSGAVMTPQYDDGRYRIQAVGAQGQFELNLGPFDDGAVAGDVTDAVLQLAYDDLGWPPASTNND